MESGLAKPKWKRMYTKNKKKADRQAGREEDGMQTRVSTETAVIESLSRKSSGVSRAKGAPHTFFAAMIAIGSGCESI